MEEFKNALYEIYMNYDTAQYLKDDKQTTNDIVKMFTEELEYSEDLTNNLLKYNKSFLKSIAMRIKLKMKNNIDNNTIKKEILTYDKTLHPLLEKLLTTSNFEEQYKEVLQVTQKVMPIKEDDISDAESEDPKEEEEEEEEEVEYNSMLSFIENKVSTTDESEFIKVNELYKYYCSYCEDNDIEKSSKSEFKNFLFEKWGKSTKSGYYGFKL